MVTTLSPCFPTKLSIGAPASVDVGAEFVLEVRLRVNDGIVKNSCKVYGKKNCDVAPDSPMCAEGMVAEVSGLDCGDAQFSETDAQGLFLPGVLDFPIDYYNGSTDASVLIPCKSKPAETFSVNLAYVLCSDTGCHERFTLTDPSYPPITFPLGLTKLDSSDRLVMQGLNVTISGAAAVTAVEEKNIGIGGSDPGAILGEVWFVILVTAFFLILALQMVGLLPRLRLPEKCQERLTQTLDSSSCAGQKSKEKGCCGQRHCTPAALIGAFMKGCVLGLIAAPCVGPFAASLLILIATDGDGVNQSRTLKAATALWTFGLGLSTPLLILAVISGSVSRLRFPFWLRNCLGFSASDSDEKCMTHIGKKIKVYCAFFILILAISTIGRLGYDELTFVLLVIVFASCAGFVTLPLCR
eukprot:g3367.t1